MVSLPELLPEPGELELVMVEVHGEGHGDQGGDYEKLHDSELMRHAEDTESDLETILYQQGWL